MNTQIAQQSDRIKELADQIDVATTEMEKVSRQFKLVHLQSLQWLIYFSSKYIYTDNCTT